MDSWYWRGLVIRISKKWIQFTGRGVGYKNIEEMDSWYWTGVDTVANAKSNVQLITPKYHHVTDWEYYWNGNSHTINIYI